MIQPCALSLHQLFPGSSEATTGPPLDEVANDLLYQVKPCSACCLRITPVTKGRNFMTTICIVFMACIYLPIFRPEQNNSKKNLFFNSMWCTVGTSVNLITNKQNCRKERTQFTSSLAGLQGLHHPYCSGVSLFLTVEWQLEFLVHPLTWN